MNEYVVVRLSIPLLSDTYYYCRLNFKLLTDIQKNNFYEKVIILHFCM